MMLLLADSLGDGFAATKISRSYAVRVQSALAKRHPTTLVRATKMGLGRHRARSVRAFPSGADLTIIELGTNDYAQTELSHFQRDYRHLVGMVYRASPHTRLLCLSVWQSPLLLKGPAGSPPGSYNEVIRHECRHGRFVFISDLFPIDRLRGPAGLKTFSRKLSDTFHPNDEGHAAIAATILENLR